MKILVIIPTLLTGGGQRIAMDIASNDSNFVFLVIGKRVDNSYTKEVEEYHKVYYMDKELGFDPKVFFKIRKVIKVENPEVVHFHLGVSLYGLIPCFFRKKTKLVYTFHTIAEKDSEGLVRKLCSAGIKYGNLIPVAITETVRDSIQEMYGLSEVKMIYNGINLSKYYSYNKRDNNEICLIAVGQIWKAKNHFFLIDVMDKLRSKADGVKFRLTILGEGPLREELERYINRKELTNLVELKGNVDNVADYLAESDIFVLSSNYEGLSLATMEAMASSLPVVSLDVGGMKDLVHDNGFLVPFADIDFFVEKVMELGANSELRKKMGEKSFEYAKKYDIEKMRQAYLELYRS